MKKSALHEHRCTPFTLAICLLIVLPQLTFAQGFFTQTNQANFGLIDARFEYLPDGYEVKVSYSPGLTEAFCTGYLNLDLEGQETGWLSEDCYPYDFLIPTQYFWLPDDDILSTHSWVDSMMHFVKIHPGGDTVWHSTTPKILTGQNVFTVEQNDAGEIFILGTAYENPNQVQDGLNELFLLKFDANGNLLWQRNEPTTFNLPLLTGRLALMPDGGCVYSIFEGYTSGQYHSLTRVTNTGDIAWNESLSWFYGYMLTDAAGNIYGLSSKNTAPDTDTRLIKRDPQGEILWENNLNEAGITQYAAALARAVNGDILIASYKAAINQSDFDLDFARFAPDGAFLWKKNYSFLNSQGANLSIHADGSPDNGFIVAGTLADSLFVLKMGPNGEVYPGTVSGRLALDENVNCLNDTLEQPLANWKVQLAGGIHLFATTDSTGAYLMEDVPGGDYQLSALPMSNVWESCPAAVPVVIPDSGFTMVNQDFSIQSLVDCPFMTVDLSTPLLRRCFENTYTVYYCNVGSAAADNAFVEVVLDPGFDFNAAGIPFEQNGDTLQFQLGTVAALECGSFQFSVTPNCDTVEIGQTLCVNASIFPDTICNPPLDWSGATLVGSAACESDSVRFTLKNIGNSPSTPALDFIVVDDHVIMMQAPLPSLAPEAEYIATAPANGSSWRFIADQEPNHPGNESVSVGVEGCGGFFAPGFLLQFPNSDGNPFSARDCQEVVGSWDPNDKSAAPRGIGDEHFIEPGTALTYRIRFQNTGTDTAFTVVVRDTLSPWLDPATLRVGAASHAYEYDMSGTGILTFSFSNIALPDSNINEPASHGFVQFSIEQKTTIPLGSILENRAGIYFDFNPVVLTNIVWHTVDTGFLKVYVSTNEPKNEVSDLSIFPNPAGEAVWVNLPPDAHFVPGDRLFLFDVFGKKVFEKPVTAATVEVRRGALPAGMYWVEYTGERSRKWRGKLIFH